MTEPAIQQKSENKKSAPKLIINVVKWGLAAILVFIFCLLFYKKCAG